MIKLKKLPEAFCLGLGFGNHTAVCAGYMRFESAKLYVGHCKCGYPAKHLPHAIGNNSEIIHIAPPIDGIIK